MPDSFLQKNGWGEAQVSALPGDASSRSYARLRLGARTALLMNQPQGAEAHALSPRADEAARRASGYNAIARLAGADCRRFAAVSEYLRGRGLAAPKILAADFDRGLVLIEDFGDALFADVLAADAGAEDELYRAAIEVLARLHGEAAPAELPGGLPLHPYDEIALIAETDLLPQWFLPLALGRPASEAEFSQHRAFWAAALAGIARGPKVFVHRDYHAQNLLWMPARQGLARVGLIDFQDAVAGSRAYDLVSLVEDARRAVSPQAGEKAIAHYLAVMRGAGLDEKQFRHEIAVMAAQRNVKIVGIFARLFSRDGKGRYLSYLPLVWSYLERDLAHPALVELRAWYDRVLPKERRALVHLEKEKA